MNVLITGGSGMVGQQLITFLNKKGYHTAILSTKKGQLPNTFYWNPSKGIVDEKALTWADSIIHLAGAGIVDKKWTDLRKQILKESRVDSALLLLEKIKELNTPITSFISASGIGYYGTNKETNYFNENNPAGTDFVAQLCVKWENAAKMFAEVSSHVSIFRIGIVLSNKGGALPKLTKPIKLGIGAHLGTGKQIMPWIHIDDLCCLLIFGLEEKLNGVFNAVADEQPTNKLINLTIANLIKKKIRLPNVPPFFLKLLLGERANIILKGNKVSNQKIKNLGFQFKYTNIVDALKKECI